MEFSIHGQTELHSRYRLQCSLKTRVSRSRGTFMPVLLHQHVSLDRAWSSHYLVKGSGDVGRVLFQKIQGETAVATDAALGSSTN